MGGRHFAPCLLDRISISGINNIPNLQLYNVCKTNIHLQILEEWNGSCGCVDLVIVDLLCSVSVTMNPRVLP